jgi:hypothetical protein
MMLFFAQHQPVTIVTGDEAAAVFAMPVWFPWAGGVIIVALLGVLLMRWRARAIARDPLACAFHGLASSLKLTRGERVLVRELARVGGLSAAGVMLSRTAFERSLTLLTGAGVETSVARVLRDKLAGHA